MAVLVYPRVFSIELEYTKVVRRQVASSGGAPEGSSARLGAAPRRVVAPVSQRLASAPLVPCRLPREVVFSPQNKLPDPCEPPMSFIGSQYLGNLLAGDYHLLWVATPSDWTIHTPGKRAGPHYQRIQNLMVKARALRMQITLMGANFQK